MKKAVQFLFIICLSNVLQAQDPQIKWWFDTKDASYGQTAAADIDHDGYLELVFGCYRNDSSVYALNAEDGSLLWKYNASSPWAEGCNDVAPLIYDVDDDDTLDVIVPASCNPTTFCFNGHTGKIKWQQVTRGSDSPPTIADLDNDGKPEILHGEFGGYVICLNAEDGSVAWEIAVDLHSWIQTAPTIIDLDGDLLPDFVVATWNSVEGDTNKVYAYRGFDHELLWTYPLADVVYHGTAVADLDDDGKPELVLGDYSGKLYALNGEDGSLYWDYLWAEGYYAGAPASIGDLDHDGICEVVFVSWFKVIALRSDGELFWHYSIPDYATAFRGAAIADINGDDFPDVIFGTSEGRFIALNGVSGNAIYNTDLSDHYGDVFDINHAPVIADFDKDGILDAFLIGGYAEYPNFENNYGRGYALSLASGNGPDWLMFQHDFQRRSSLCGDTLTDILSPSAPLIHHFSAFPNPFSNQVSFIIDSPGSILICDLLGRLLKEIKVDGTQVMDVVHWDCAGSDGQKLSPGVYLAVFEGKNGFFALKLIAR